MARQDFSLGAEEHSSHFELSAKMGMVQPFSLATLPFGHADLHIILLSRSWKRITIQLVAMMPR
jgi:hypothetical protein